MTSIPLVRRTRATLRSAEFGFFGVVAYTRVHTPRFCGLPRSAGAVDLRLAFCRPLRISWLMVGIARSSPIDRPGRAGGRCRGIRREGLLSSRAERRKTSAPGPQIPGVVRLWGRDGPVKPLRPRALLAERLGKLCFRLVAERHAELLVRREARPRRDQAAHDDVLLAPAQVVDRALDRGLGQHPRGLLERRGRQ